MNITVVQHPLIQHKLGLLREGEISTMKFRQLTQELARLLAYEATRDFELETVSIKGWNGEIEVQQIKGKKVTVVPILRAGVGMLDGVLDLVPSAKISVVGRYRNEETLEPVPYFDKFVDSLDERIALIIDPMLATGGSMIATIDLLKRKGCKQISIIRFFQPGNNIIGHKTLAVAHYSIYTFTSTPIPDKHMHMVWHYHISHIMMPQ